MCSREEEGCHMRGKPEASPNLTAGLLSIKQMFLEVPEVLSKFTLCKSFGNPSLIPHSKVSNSCTQLSPCSRAGSQT